MNKEERLRRTKIGMIPYTEKKCLNLYQWIVKHGGLRMLEFLTEKEKTVILMRIRDNKGQADIAKEMGYCQQRVAIIIRDSKRKIKKQLKVESFIY